MLRLALPSALFLHPQCTRCTPCLGFLCAPAGYFPTILISLLEVLDTATFWQYLVASISLDRTSPVLEASCAYVDLSHGVDLDASACRRRGYAGMLGRSWLLWLCRSLLLLFAVVSSFP